MPNKMYLFDIFTQTHRRKKDGFSENTDEGCGVLRHNINLPSIVCTIRHILWLTRASLVSQTVKNLPAMWETWVRSLSWEDPRPGGGHGNSLQYSCLENPRGQRSLTSYSPWRHKESDMTEWLSIAQHSTWLTNYTLEIRRADHEVGKG